MACTASSGGRRTDGRALLETDELLFRSDGLRLRIPYASITAVRRLWVMVCAGSVSLITDTPNLDVTRSIASGVPVR